VQRTGLWGEKRKVAASKELLFASGCTLVNDHCVQARGSAKSIRLAGKLQSGLSRGCRWDPFCYAIPTKRPILIAFRNRSDVRIREAAVSQRSKMTEGECAGSVRATNAAPAGQFRAPVIRRAPTGQSLWSWVPIKILVRARCSCPWTENMNFRTAAGAAGSAVSLVVEVVAVDLPGRAIVQSRAVDCQRQI